MKNITTYKTLIFESSEKVGYITLNRPQVHNAFDEEMIAELTDCFEKVESDPLLETLVLKSNVKSFCSGADINWMKSMIDYTYEENYADSKKLAHMMSKLNNLPQYTIAIVDGIALGGGVGLCCCVDHVIASHDAVFGLTEVKIGLVPAVISPYVISKIGQAHARRYFVTGDRIDSIEGLRIGLIDDLVEDIDLIETLTDTIMKLSSSGKEAKKLAKELCLNIEKLPQDKVEDYTCELIAKTRVSDEAQEGMKAILDKRKPTWSSNKQ